MVDKCKKCNGTVTNHYEAGFDIYTCKKCNIRVDGRHFFDHFYEDDS